MMFKNGRNQLSKPYADVILLELSRVYVPYDAWTHTYNIPRYSFGAPPDAAA